MQQRWLFAPKHRTRGGGNFYSVSGGGVWELIKNGDLPHQLWQMIGMYVKGHSLTRLDKLEEKLRPRIGDNAWKVVARCLVDDLIAGSTEVQRKILNDPKFLQSVLCSLKEALNRPNFHLNRDKDLSVFGVTTEHGMRAQLYRVLMKDGKVGTELVIGDAASELLITQTLPHLPEAGSRRDFYGLDTNVRRALAHAVFGVEKVVEPTLIQCVGAESHSLGHMIMSAIGSYGRMYTEANLPSTRAVDAATERCVVVLASKTPSPQKLRPLLHSTPRTSAVVICTQDETPVKEFKGIMNLYCVCKMSVGEGTNKDFLDWTFGGLRVAAGEITVFGQKDARLEVLQCSILERGWKAKCSDGSTNLKQKRMQLSVLAAELEDISATLGYLSLKWTQQGLAELLDKIGFQCIFPGNRSHVVFFDDMSAIVLA